MAEGADDETFEMKTEHGEAVSLTLCGGDMLPTNFGNLPQRMDYIPTLKYKERDVILATYAKCGTHWVMGLMKHLLASEVQPEMRSVYKEQKLGWLFNALCEKEAYDSAISPRIIPTHLKPNRIPPAMRRNHTKVVLVLRNPKDVAVSYYHHLKDAKVIKNKQTWDEFLTSYQNGLVPFGCYMDYLDAWEAEIKETTTQSLDIEYFYYEDFKMNGLETMKKLAKYLNVEKEESELMEILNSCTLTKLQEAENQRELYPGIQREDGKGVIFRKGIIGDWKTMFTVAQSEQYDKYLEIRLTNFKFKFCYT